MLRLRLGWTWLLFLALDGCALNFGVGSLPPGNTTDAARDAIVSDGGTDAGVDAVDRIDVPTTDVPSSDHPTADTPIDRVESDNSADHTATDAPFDVMTDTVPPPDAPVEDGPCIAPRAICGTACVDPRSDPANCGACGIVCPGAANATAVCSQSNCSFVCNAPFADCDGMASTGCEANTQTDDNHCSNCSTVCHGAHFCDAGVCTL